MEVRSHQGDSVDSLCWRHLRSSAAVETTLELNPGLAALGPVLPDGTLVTLPEEHEVETGKKNLVQLWD